MTTRRRFLSQGVLLAGWLGAAPSQATARGRTPWRNWSGRLTADPQARITPASEQELADYLRGTTGALRPVGAGHSFSPLVPTEGHLMVVDRMAGLLNHDTRGQQATFGAGTRLSETGPALASADQALQNLPDIDRQTIAGAIATATHGTGAAFTSLSGYVTHLRLVTPGGHIRDLSSSSDPDLFDAARVSLGALGVVTRVTIGTRSAYRLKQTMRAQNTMETLEGFDDSAHRHRHFEMFPLTHSSYSIVLATDETSDPIDNPTPSPEEADAFDAMMRSWLAIPPAARRDAIDPLAAQLPATERVDVSYRILPNVRNTRFNEMEYSVPVDAGAACLREILTIIEREQIDVVMPLEYRYVHYDDTWLGMSAGAYDHAAISVHRLAGSDPRGLFERIEPIFWKYEGRPHWGKMHSLGAAELGRLYPRFDDFRSIREEVDPHGRMLNPHLRHVFGVDT